MTSAAQDNQEGVSILFLADVLARVGVNKRTLATWIDRGRFPAAISDVNGRRVWSSAAVARWTQAALAGEFSAPRRPTSTAHQAAL